MDMLRPHRFDAVVFDLDGTLVDSAPDIHVALNRLLAEHDRPTVDLEAASRMVGDGAAKLVERGFLATGDPLSSEDLDAAVTRYLEIYQARLIVDTRPFPGLVEALGRLAGQGCRLGVCTNKPAAPTLGTLDELGLADYFDAVIAGDTLAVRKPDPAPLLSALTKLGADPSTAILVGDSPIDVATARAAGVPVVAVSFGYSRIPVAELGADRLIDDYRELDDALVALSA
ncbi:MAG: phosphoglycolate phosphatase [Alphaproteobacteria bacterium]|nr:phosphoglycolate phosphatase [Alphaproteobacteria bacterium]